MNRIKIISILVLILVFSESFFLITTFNNQGTTYGQTSSQDLGNSTGSTTKISAFGYTTTDVENIIGLTWLRNQGYTGSGVTIGIVDTGINNITYASEFGNRVLAGQSFVTTTNNYGANDTTLTDTHGHGTEVASIVAGTNHGMAPAADLLEAKIYSLNIAGNDGKIMEETTRGVYEGIVYCVQHNASIINLSFGQYSNIVNDGRQYIIDKMSQEHNVIFVIAAGNDGVSGEDGSTIGTPATAFQAITVGASNGLSGMAYFSSSGIRSDYTVKPDVSAPGYNVSTVGGYVSGTSIASPVVAGGIAVLIQALRTQSRNYTVGAIKAALLETANPFPNTPVWYQGAGMVNITAAYELLMGKSVDTPNSVPIIASAFPKTLPIDPINTIFINQTTPFNLTVVSGQYDQATITLHGIPQEIMSFNSVQYFNGSQRLSLLFHPQTTTTSGSYAGYLELNFSLGTTVNVNIQFTVKKPTLSILFDESKNGFTNMMKPAGISVQGPWGYSTFLLGQFREFYKLLASNNISLTPFYKGSYTNLTYLQQFDEIIFPYPNTKVTNPFTDWYNDSLFGNTFTLTEPSLLFTSTELATLKSYVQDYSKGILILANDHSFFNTTAFDGLLHTLGIGYTINTIVTQAIPMPVTSSNSIFAGVSKLDFYGSAFSPDGTNTGTPVQALESNKFLLVDNQSKTLTNSGRILVSGSGYFAENFMLAGVTNANYQNDGQLVLNMVTWLRGGLTNPINPPTSTIPITTTPITTTPPSSTPPISSTNQPISTTPASTSNNEVSSSVKTSTTNTGSSTQTTSLNILTIMLAVPVVAIISRKRRN